MFTRKDAVVALAACTLLAGASLAKAETTPALTLSPSVVHLDEAAPRGLLMQGMDKIGAGKTLDEYGINIYGWDQSGYEGNLRNNASSSSRPNPFTTEPGNHYQHNQLVLRVEKQVDLKKFDVGGMVELMFGTDSNYTQANGMQIQTNGAKHLQDSDNVGEHNILDIPQAYIDIAIPVGNGLKVRAGKFVTLLSYETIAAPNNPFYTHSYVFNAVAFTHTGVLATYAFNDQWAVTGGVTRGWNQSTEDNNGAVDFLGQAAWTPNKKLTALLNLSVGPQDNNDTSHYRTTINPVISYKLTEKLTVAADALYTYDGGAAAPGYGDQWGAALYAGYELTDMFTLNGRGEMFHDDTSMISVTNTNVYEITAGVTITPMPTNKYLKGLKIRPEIRYDYCEDKAFMAGNNSYHDNWTVGADLIMSF